MKNKLKIFSNPGNGVRHAKTNFFLSFLKGDGPWPPQPKPVNKFFKLKIKILDYLDNGQRNVKIR